MTKSQGQKYCTWPFAVSKNFFALCKGLHHYSKIERNIIINEQGGKNEIRICSGLQPETKRGAPADCAEKGRSAAAAIYHLGRAGVLFTYFKCSFLGSSASKPGTIPPSPPGRERTTGQLRCSKCLPFDAVFRPPVLGYGPQSSQQIREEFPG